MTPLFPGSLTLVLPALLAAQHQQPQVVSAGTSTELGSGFPALVAEPLDLNSGFLESGDAFATAAAGLGDLDGDGVEELAVGVPGEDSTGFDRGAVAVFFGGGPAARPRHLIANGSGGFEGTILSPGRFGSALAPLGDLDGDGIRELAVGAPNAGGGRVWILFLGDDGRVRQEQEIGASIGGFVGQVQQFGAGLATLGDLDGDGVPELAVGDPATDDQGTGSGTVWVLFLRADGQVDRQQRIGNSFGGFGGGLTAFDRFGSALAGPGDLNGDGVEDLIVGAPFDDTGSNDDSGSLWVLFLAADGTVVGQVNLLPFETGLAGRNDHYGAALVALGDLDGNGTRELAVGAPDDDAGGGDRGAVWILSLNGSGSVVAQRKISSTSGGFVGPLVDFDRFGFGVALLEDRDGDGIGELFVGAPLGEEPPCLSVGEGWFLFLNADGSLHGDRRGGGTCIVTPANGRYGTSMADVGDLGADGMHDIAVGSVREPRLRLVRVDAQGKYASHLVVPSFANQGPRYAAALANLGDLDGDGSVELAVGSPNGTGAAGAIGVLWILSLGSDGSLLRHTQVEGPLLPRSRFGRALAALGDRNGDGVGDVAAGIPGADTGGVNSGGLQILLLKSDGSVLSRTTIDGTNFAGVNPGDRFGTALASLGDLDGNGVGDLAVGAPGFDATFEDRGQVWILFLRANGTVLRARRITTGQGGFPATLNAADRFGTALAALPDLDGDGLRELLVGAPGDDSSAHNAGTVWALFLAADGTVKSAQRLSPSLGFPAEVGENSGFGGALAAVDDVNGDGRPEFAVGAPADDRALPNAGMAWLALLGGAGRIDFQTEDDLVTPLVNGQALSTPPEFGRLFRLSASGTNLGPAIFDSSPGGPNDPSQDLDLLVDKGNVMLLQTTQAPTQSTPGVFDHPNDSSLGGKLRFEFLVPQQLLSLDLVDVDLGSGRFAYVRLTDTAGRWREYTVPPGWTEDLVNDGAPGWRTLRLTTLAPQPGFRASATVAQLGGFDAEHVLLLEVTLEGSGAVDDLVFQPGGG